MRWIALFEDHAEREWIRKQHAGAQDAWYCGGLWIMEVESRDEAARLVQGDRSLGLRKGYRLLVWGKAPCYEAVTL